MKDYQVVIRGVPPGLLQHRFSDQATADIENAAKRIKAEKLPPTAQAEQGAYRMDSDELYQPAEHIYQSLIKASTDFQVVGRGKKTYRDAVKGNVIIMPDQIGHGRSDYEIDSRRVKIGRGCDVRHRPLLTEWSLSFSLRVLNPEFLPAEVLNSILVNAGQCVGIGDYRPRFGRFLVENFRAL